MTSVLTDLSAKYLKPRPEIRPGFTVRVHERIQEGGKERIQIFEGLVISVHKGSTPSDTTFTVRKIASGVGVEKVFSLHSPKIEKIEVKKVARVRRAKLFFLRGRRGKAARLSERFTTADEFAVVAPAEAEVVEQEAVEEKAEEVAKEAPAEPEAKKEEPTEEKAEEATEKKAEKEAPAEEKKEEDKKEE